MSNLEVKEAAISTYCMCIYLLLQNLFVLLTYDVPNESVSKIHRERRKVLTYYV